MYSYVFWKMAAKIFLPPKRIRIILLKLKKERTFFKFPHTKFLYFLLYFRGPFLQIIFKSSCQPA